MGIETAKKINQLLSQWQEGAIYSTSALLKQGYSHQHLQKYKRGNWIEAIGTGAYKKFGDQVNWAGGVWALQTQMNLPIHVGGKTALEIAGKTQYLQFLPKQIDLMTTQKKVYLPTWFKKYSWDVKLNFQIKNLFGPSPTVLDKNQLGLSEKELGNFKIIMSAPERAFLEYLDELPKKYSYQEAKDIMENLTSLRSAVLQNLLEKCTSLKVKRLFLHLADKVHHPWFEKLDPTSIPLGKGKRSIFPSGVLDQKYQITVPKDEHGSTTV